jgi:hypothetical protein
MNDGLDLLDLVPTDSPREGMPSPAQVALINKLTDELRELDTDLADKAEEYTARMAGKWDRGRDGNVSRWIGRLIKKINEVKDSRTVGDGMYLMDDVVYKVQHAIHGSGKPYAKMLVPNAPGEKARFEYAPGAINKLRPEHKMTMEQAKEWGALYGTCVRCGLLLTREDSIERKMGLTCFNKF